jgi:hypothetical protein
MKRKMLGVVIASTFSMAAAQGLPLSFPEGSLPLTAELFQSKVAGKNFSGWRADGELMRLDIDLDGTLTWYSRKASERGKWKLEGDRFCQELFRFGSGCNEFRIGDGVIYYKRNVNGEVVTLKAL